MHELSIAEALIEQAERAANDAGQSGRIARLELTIGRMSGVCSDSLRFAFDLISPGTRVEGAELQITEPNAVCHCVDCGSETEVSEFVVRCPSCNSEAVRIEGGRELLLQSLEIDEDESASNRVPNAS